MSSLKTTTKNHRLIYDVGLHRGQDTDFYLKMGFDVIAFEANPENADFCRNRFKAAIEAGHLTIVEGAISEDVVHDGNDKVVKFYRNANHSLWGSTSEDWAVRNVVMGTTNEIISVPAIDFGEQMEKYGVPYYLKADIVGSETICLRAMLAFENKPDYISIRSEKLVFTKLLYEFDLLEQLGYHEFKVLKQDFESVKPELPTGNAREFHTFEEGASGPFGEETVGKWKGREAVVKDYKTVFVKYWLFGDYSYLIQTESGRKFIAAMERLIRRSIPGWYDTHARHSTIQPK